MATVPSTLSVPSAAALPSHLTTEGRGSPTRIPLAHRSAAAERRRYEVVHAITGNHLAIQGLLQRLLHQPLPAEFAAATLRPGYSPSERLLIKRPSDCRLVAHLQLQPQTMRFGQVMVPVVRLRDLAVQAEYQLRGFSDQMLLAAEQDAQRSGVMIMTACGADDEAFDRRGWAHLGSNQVGVVSPQRLMGQLPPPRQPESPFYADALPHCAVRLGRLTDLAAMSRLYEHQALRSHGPPVRNEEYWSWLVSRGAHDRFYLYIEDEQPLAYVVVRGASVLELVDQTDAGRGAAQLLKRVGADAIEQGWHSLRIHAPLTDPVHTWLELAGGQLSPSSDEPSWRARIVSPRKLLRRLGTELYRRYDSRMPTELSLQIGSDDLLLRPGVRSLRVTRGVARKHRLSMSHQAATQLVFGYCDVQQLAARGQLVASSAKALDAARKLFPSLDIWRPVWDDVPVTAP